MAQSDMMAEFIGVYMSSLKNLEKLISQPTSAYGISFEQWLIMSAVAHSRTALTLTEIAAERGVTKGAVARQLKPLFEKEYLQQVTDDKDRRRVLLHLTETGVVVETTITEKVSSRFNKWLGIYGLEEGKSLLAHLHRLEDLIVKPELAHKNIEK